MCFFAKKINRLLFSLSLQDNSRKARELLEPYLPKDDSTSGSPYEAGGGLYALGLINASHGSNLVPYISNQLSLANNEVGKMSSPLFLLLRRLPAPKRLYNMVVHWD